MSWQLFSRNGSSRSFGYPYIVSMSLHLPEPQIIDPASVPALRWGIFGTGWISEEFATSCMNHNKQHVVTVASRTEGSAQTFAEKVGLPGFDESYETLAARDDIDAVYIGTRPGKHLEHALIAINAGKHVLIEKPITIDASEAQQTFSAAKAAGVFAMEAMWNRYLPQASIVRQLRDSDALGEPRLLLMDFCQDHAHIEARWRDVQSSVMYDMGIYPVATSIEYMGYPTRISAVGKRHPGGLESEVTAILDYANGARTIMTVSGLNHAPHHATVSGTNGILEFHAPYVIPSGISFSEVGFNQPTVDWADEYAPRGHQGLNYEVTAFAKFVGEGLIESPFHPHEQSVAAVRLVGEILAALQVS